MNLRQLELFVAVAETKSFSRGADIICLTQSTVSQHIAALEDEVATRLFDRTQKGALLTSGGQVFLRHARRVLAERDLLLQEMTSFSGLQKGQLLIGASSIPANHLIPAVLPQLASLHPGVSITMQSGDSQGILQRLLNAEFDLAVVGSCPVNDKLEFTALASDLLILIVGAQHRWRQRTEVTLEELRDEPLVARESSSGSQQALLRELQRLSFNVEHLKIAARLGSNEAVRQVVAAGYGCAFVSERSVRRELQSGELCQVAVAGMRVARHFWLVSLRGRTLSPAAAAVAELLLGSYRAENR
jgi:DNA-binding transcriptional LysR family regulator